MLQLSLIRSQLILLRRCSGITVWSGPGPGSIAVEDPVQKIMHAFRGEFDPGQGFFEYHLQPCGVLIQVPDAVSPVWGDDLGLAILVCMFHCSFVSQNILDSN